MSTDHTDHADPTLRSRAERAFHAYLDRTRDGTVIEPTQFIAAQETAVQDELKGIFADYEALRTTLGDRPTEVASGHVIDDFELRFELGRGGMGVVWEAEQVSLKRPVALKLLFPHHGLAQGSLERFLREGEAGARLRHPNIATVYGVGDCDGIHYIAQELVPGGYSLADRLMELALAERRDAHERTSEDFLRVAELFAKVADACQAAHDAAVVHRDLKPSNILLAEDDQPKIIDFGLARLQDTLGITRTDVLAGTPAYMSPEQAESSAKTVDHRTDVFSLGATFYEALTLKRAFDGDTHHQVLDKVVRVDPADPRTLRSRVPRDLAVIAMKAIEKSPERRYQSMSELAADLRRFQRHEPIAARPPGALVKGAKWARRHPVASALLAAAAPVIVLLWTLLLREQQARDAAQQATAQAVESEQDARRSRGEALVALDRAEESARVAREREYHARVQAAAFSLELGRDFEARVHLDACAEELRGVEWDHLTLLADPSLTVTRGVPDGVHAVSWSEGRPRLATAPDGGRSIRIWTPDDGSTQAELRSDGSGEVVALAFSADGARLAAARSSLAVDVWDVATGARLATLHVDDDPTAVALDHDGRHAAVIVDKGASAVVFDVGTAEERHHVRYGDTRFSAVAFPREAPKVELFGGVVVGRAAKGLNLVLGGVDGSILFWDDSDEAPDVALRGHRAAVRSLVFAPDGSFLVSGGADRTLRVWRGTSSFMTVSITVNAEHEIDGQTFDVPSRNTTSDELLTVYRGHGGPVRSVAIGDDGARLVSVSDDGTVRTWSALGWEPVTQLGDWPDSFQSFGWSHDGAALLCGKRRGVVEIRDARSGALIESLTTQDASVEAIALHPDGDLIATGGEDGEVAVWSRSAREQRFRVSTPGDAVEQLAFTPDGGRLVACFGTPAVQVFDADRGEVELLLLGHEDRVRGFAIGPAGARIATASNDRTVRVWDATSGAELHVLRGHEHPVVAVAFAPDGESVVSGDAKGTLRRYRLADGACTATVTRHGDECEDLDFSADGSRLLVTSTMRSLALVDPTDLSIIVDLPVLTGFPMGSAFSPDGARIATLDHLGPLRILETTPPGPRFEATRAAR